MKNSELRKKLIEKKRSERYKYHRKTLVWEVCNEALNSGDIKIFFEDLFRNGCVSGMIDGLVWYSDTEKFYDKYYDDIEKLRGDWEKSVGESLKIEPNLKNFFAWFGFEETAYRLAGEIGLEV